MPVFFVTGKAINAFSADKNKIVLDTKLRAVLVLACVEAPTDLPQLAVQAKQIDKVNQPRRRKGQAKIKHR
jgi:hypothetical protein